MARATTFVLLILAVWFCLALGIGLTGIFKSASAPTTALTVWILTALALIACWKVPPLNRWAMETQVSWLIALHLIRFVGIYFLLLCRSGELSCIFAKPAGIGDITIAIGAAMLLLFVGNNVAFGGKPMASPAVSPIRLAAPVGGRSIIVWNILGLLDILAAVFSAMRVGLNDWPSMAPLRALPLSLLPTFLVPLIITSHIVIFFRLTKRRGELVSSH